MTRFWLRLLGAIAACLAVGLAIAWLLFVVWLHAPAAHVRSAIVYLLTSGVVSLVVGFSVMALAARLVPSLWLKIVIAIVAGSAAAILDVLYTPLLMFVDPADKHILAVTLLYFLALSVAFAFLVAALTTQQVSALRAGARRLAAGELGTTVDVRGVDEVAELARAFNRMSQELAQSIGKERRLEEERRVLFASISHDLRTPLASIRAMVEAINDRVVTEPLAVQRYLALIQSETEHLGRLIDDLFELARIESGSLELRLQAVPLPALVAETVAGLQLQAHEKGIDLHAEWEGDLPPLAIDGPRMQRVLTNLIQNALRHTPAGGRVDVCVARANGRVMLSVTDSGEGIAAEDRQHVFERFYRGEKSRSRERGGAGLGLAIARGIVEAHHGTIEVASPPGEGARIVITLGASS
ncbi:MAG TPA: HAMP domain-containing sensor histidine kinase [Chloroflexota bacterium]|nr:HAMP domain-containing sensor histidine kinase [Chloroflexota bacterium]